MSPTSRRGRGPVVRRQILIAEGSSLLLVLLATGIRSGESWVVGAGGMVLSPAIVHAAHANFGKAVASVGIHVALGVGASWFSNALIPCGGEFCSGTPLVALGIAIVASQMIATLIDVESFAYDRVPSRLSVGVLLAPPGADRQPAYRLPPGFQFSLRF
jgi:hypothetical protein